MKLKSVFLTEEVQFKKYEDFVSTVEQAINENNLKLFQQSLDRVLRMKKYDWFGMWFQQVDRDKDISKAMFKALNF
mgnify:FL=1